jgi:hypothetical protein
VYNTWYSNFSLKENVIEGENTQKYTLDILWKLVSWKFCVIKHDMKVHSYLKLHLIILRNS